jgi:hypothetical protein
LTAAGIDNGPYSCAQFSGNLSRAELRGKRRALHESQKEGGVDEYLRATWERQLGNEAGELANAIEHQSAAKQIAKANDELTQEDETVLGNPWLSETAGHSREHRETSYWRATTNDDEHYIYAIAL